MRSRRPAEVKKQKRTKIKINKTEETRAEDSSKRRRRHVAGRVGGQS